jgi:hypothetical protein
MALAPLGERVYGPMSRAVRSGAATSKCMQGALSSSAAESTFGPCTSFGSLTGTVRLGRRGVSIRVT